MSRTKDKITKLMAGKSMLEKVRMAEVGTNADSELFDQADALVHLIKHAAFLEQFEIIPKAGFEGGMGKTELRKWHRKWSKFHRDRAWEALSKVFHREDASLFFHAMGDALELSSKPIDPRQSFVFTQIGAAEAFGLPLPTIPKLMKDLEKNRLKTDRRTLRRIVEQYAERKLPKANAGRPKK